MSRDYEPVPGQWYENLEDEESFRVLTVDEDSELVEIEYLDGEIEEIDLETWHEMDLEKTDEPEGWAESEGRGRGRGRRRKKTKTMRTTGTRTRTRTRTTMTGTKTRKTSAKNTEPHVHEQRGVDSWYHEKESAWLYRQVAAAEPDPHKQRLFTQLAAAAEEQAAKWDRFPQRGAAPRAAAPARVFAPSLRARIVAAIAAAAGTRARALGADGDEAARPVDLHRARRRGHAMPTTLSDVGVRHRGGLGGNLRATVFGVNDGLVSNASLVLGVAGAVRAGLLRADQRRRRPARRRAVDGGGRVCLGALAARDVRVPDRARARRDR